MRIKLEQSNCYKKERHPQTGRLEEVVIGGDRVPLFPMHRNVFLYPFDDQDDRRDIGMAYLDTLKLHITEPFTDIERKWILAECEKLAGVTFRTVQFSNYPTIEVDEDDTEAVEALGRAFGEGLAAGMKGETDE